jgi:hypothetical protein
VAVSLGIGRPFLRTELVPASGTTISPRQSASNPFLHPAVEELQINEIVTKLFAFLDLFAVALGASLALYRIHFVDAN